MREEGGPSLKLPMSIVGLPDWNGEAVNPSQKVPERPQ
jgi:hypothetical protein